MAKELIKGNTAIAEAAIRFGLEAYFGYPITPQTELLEWLAKRMPELNRPFVQAESELAAINMVYGAACAGKRVMTSSSSPGISLMMEGLSYIAGTEIPAVVVDVMRGGPGLGNIAPAQSDYNQIVHGGPHGDVFPIVLAPANVQEAIDLTGLSFELAEKYSSLTFLLLDGYLGQMMEPAELPPMRKLNRIAPEWAANGESGRDRNFLTSLYINPADEEVANMRMIRRWKTIEENEVRYKTYFTEDAEYLVIGFGSAGRVALSAVRAARAKGLKIGLLRPITLRPFPEKEIAEMASKVKGVLVVEMNAGQMLEDIRRITHEQTPLHFYARVGGIVPFPDEIDEAIQRMVAGKEDHSLHPRDRWMEQMAKIGF
ncbi:MAG: 3-methyl-2-oxobutanoate dehydrogenase subunit VorB [Anaerolineaceae bacterium]|nr:3-methyl-2-oxobutanoate dehydrogenase subunit VorB [Anaerolineaceae bacterium]